MRRLAIVLGALVLAPAAHAATTPSITVGEPEIGPFALNLQRTAPVAASKQKNVCEYDPTKTRPRHTAAEE